MFQVEAVDINHTTLRSATALTAVAAIALYREWLCNPETGQVTMAIPVLHRAVSEWQPAAAITPLRYGYNGEDVVAHWREIKRWRSSEFARRWRR